ncbi:TonB-dependent receptor [uncultured Polaribacter sp.]|uniref:SusC/RagA family TonB-linked outer membrane protein n=1 Tax=uncultured Polaribacter sp. TaxID=174711 RepID=UPI0026338FCE|nr:TonB-dependent receptor [uncultured Polaribacter sp.]
MTLLVLMLVSISINAQESYTIKGTVISKLENSPLPGVSIIIQNSQIGTETDFDGKYSLKVKKGDVLQFSYLGYATQNITITNQKTLNVSMLEDSSELDEIVVVGYGSRKKSDVTGAVSSVKAEELNAFPVLDAAQALQGRAAGVVVQSNNGGEPGAPISIKIRGNTSLTASSAPLIVVDGFVGASMPQANDIQSMEILKDASATAIYGSRGSNGVVLVTTKKGRKGSLSVELNTVYATQNTSNKLDLLNASDFATFQQLRNPSYTQGSENTDWQDLLYGSGSTVNHQLSFSGGTDKINFYASGNYFNQDGIILNSDFERLTFLTNIDAQVTDKLKFGANLFGSRGTQNGVPTQSTGDSANGGGDDVIGLIFRFAPDLGVFNSDGTFTENSVGDPVDNPFAVATERVNKTVSDRYRANFYGSYDIIEGLNFKSTFGFSTLNENIGTYVPSTLTLSDQGNGGKATISNRQSTNILSENYLTYTTEIGKGKFTALTGYSYQKTKTERFSAGSIGLIKDNFSYHNLAGSSGTVVPTSSLVESEILSQFGRVNYDYDDKYLLTATVRRDGASNFAEDEKYAIFPSGAFGWKISNEDFLKENETISNLKLRASYGVTGNQAIPSYSSFGRLTDVQGLSNGSVVSGVAPDQAANANLRWESSLQTNIGVDLGILNNRISFSLDYYNIDTKDLLMPDFGQPQYLGYQTAAALVNIGEINNSGFEFQINSTNINKGDFRWTTDFNISTNQTEVVKLLDGIDVRLDASPSYFSRSDTHILREGETPGAFYGYKYIGVYQGGTLPEGTATFAGGVAGDPLFADVADESGNVNGVIDTDDQMIIGDPTPNFTYGITNNFTYKNWDLNVFIQGSQGGEIFNMTNVQLFTGDGNTTYENFNNAWSTSNTNTNIPRVGNNSPREFSSRFIEDGSYVRLKNIALGYNLPESVLEKLGVQNIRLALSAQNLLTITDYSGLDPEVNYSAGEAGNNSNNTSGFDYGNYPALRTVNFSVSLKF